jgi:hypothetical protein
MPPGKKFSSLLIPADAAADRCEIATKIILQIPIYMGWFEDFPGSNMPLEPAIKKAPPNAALVHLPPFSLLSFPKVLQAAARSHAAASTKRSMQRKSQANR